MGFHVGLSIAFPHYLIDNHFTNSHYFLLPMFNGNWESTMPPQKNSMDTYQCRLDQDYTQLVDADLSI